LIQIGKDPRIDMNLFPTKTSLIRETTDLYGQHSVEVIRTEYSPGRDVVRGLGAGISVGVDWVYLKLTT